MLTVIKEFSFDYAHWLPGYNGKCRNLHGHTAKLRVEVSGPPSGEKVYPGMVVDFKDVSSIVKQVVVEVLDHQCLNSLPMFENVPPTCENMVCWIVGRLQAFFGEHLVSVELWETPTSFVRWRKE